MEDKKRMTSISRPQSAYNRELRGEHITVLPRKNLAQAILKEQRIISNPQISPPMQVARAVASQTSWLGPAIQANASPTIMPVDSCSGQDGASKGLVIRVARERPLAARREAIGLKIR